MIPIFTISTAFIISFLLSSSSLVSPLPINNDINCAILNWEEIENMPYPQKIDRLTGDEILSSNEWEKLKMFAKELPSGKLKEGFYRALRILSYALNYPEYNASIIKNDTDRSSFNYFNNIRNNDTDFEYFENISYEQYFTNDYSNGKYSSLDLSSQASRIKEEKIAYPEQNIHCTNDSSPDSKENCLTDQTPRQDKNEFTVGMSVSTQFFTVPTSENPIETEFNGDIEVLGRNELNNNNLIELNDTSQPISSENEYGYLTETPVLVENNNQTNMETYLNSIENSFNGSYNNESNEKPFKIESYETEGTPNLSMESYTNISNRSSSNELDKTSMELITTISMHNDTSEKYTISSSQASFFSNDFTKSNPDENLNIKHKTVYPTNETTESSSSPKYSSYSHSANQLKNTTFFEEEDVKKLQEFDNERFFGAHNTSDEDHMLVGSSTSGNPTWMTELGDIIEPHSSVTNDKVQSSDEEENKNYNNSHFDSHISNPPPEISSETLTTVIVSSPETILSISEKVSTSHTDDKNQSLDYVTSSEYQPAETKLRETIGGQGSVSNKEVVPIDKKGYINENNNDLNVTSSEASSETLSANTVMGIEITTLKSEDNSSMSSESTLQYIDMHVDMVKPNTLATVTTTVPTIIESNERRDLNLKSSDKNEKRIIDDNEIRSSDESSGGTDDQKSDLNYLFTTEWNTYATDGKIEILNEVEINNGKTVIPESHKISSEEITQNVDKLVSEEVGSQDHIVQTTEMTNEYAEKNSSSETSDNLSDQILTEVIEEKEPKFSTVPYEDISTALPINIEQNTTTLTNEINEPDHKIKSDEDKTYSTIEPIKLKTVSESEEEDKFTLDKIEIDPATESSSTLHYRIDNLEIKSEIEPNYGDSTLPDTNEIQTSEISAQNDDIHMTTASTKEMSESTHDNEEITNLNPFEVSPTAETNNEDDYSFGSDINNIHETVASTDKIVPVNERELDNENHEELSNEHTIQSTIGENTDVDEIITTIGSQNIAITTGSTADQIFVTHTESNYEAGVKREDLLGITNDANPDFDQVPQTDSKFTPNYQDFEGTTESTTDFVFNKVDPKHMKELEGNKNEDEIPNSHEIITTIDPNSEGYDELNGGSNGIRVTPALKTGYSHAHSASDTDGTPDPDFENDLDEQDHKKLDSHDIQFTTESYTDESIQLATQSITSQHLPGSKSDIDQDINKNVTYTDDDLEISTTKHFNYTDVYMTEPATTSYDDYLNDSKTNNVPNEHKLFTHNNREEISTSKKGIDNNYEDYSQSSSISDEKENYTPYTVASTDQNYDIVKIESINQTENYLERHNQSYSTLGSDENIEVDDILIKKSSVLTNTNTNSPVDKEEVLNHTASYLAGNNLAGESNENNLNENEEHHIPTDSKSKDPHINKILSSTPMSLTSEKSTPELDFAKPPEVVLTDGRSSEHMPESDHNIHSISSTTKNEYPVTEPNESGSYDGFYSYLSPVSKHYSQNRPLPNPVPQDLKRSNCVKVPEIIYSRR